LKLTTELLYLLSEDQLKEKIYSIEPIRAHASDRKIYRLFYEGGKTRVGIINPQIEENVAFVSFSQSFKSYNLPVPQIDATDGRYAYIQTDLGHHTLMDVLKARGGEELTPKVKSLYEQAIDQLIDFQIYGLKLIDTNFCYQGALFDSQAIVTDIQYFQNEYLSRIGLDDQGKNLEKDIPVLMNFCGDYERGFFMYRDFQSRNIMVIDDQLFFIDYQSGREGPIYYDLASLIFQSQANLPNQFREHLVGYYRSKIPNDIKFEHEKFLAFVLIRVLQNLGAYGKLGLGMNKAYFKSSIPFALKNCAYLIEHWPESLKNLSLINILKKVVDHGC